MVPVKPTSTRSFRLPNALLERMAKIANQKCYPPPPSMREIAERGLELAVRELERRQPKPRKDD